MDGTLQDQELRQIRSFNRNCQSDDAKVWKRFVVWYFIPSLLLLIAIWAFSFDLKVARWSSDEGCPKLLHEIVMRTEPFGHGAGIVIMLWAIYSLFPQNRKCISRLLWCALLPGIVANLIKLVVFRYRPVAFDLMEQSVWATFGPWTAYYSTGSACQSFPSAHTATAIGFAIGLAHFFPKGKWLFATLGVMVGFARVIGFAHYVSDVFIGAMVGWFCAQIILRSTWLDFLFTDWERSPQLSRFFKIQASRIRCALGYLNSLASHKSN
ncbi:acidPPc domain-containing protein [Planctomycetales bacterium 10988]|nr:acidPPc domain-containing protein [Planctomycetales bacterium 10988]